MSKIALFGAGGKMGYRLARNLKDSRFEVRHVEVSEAGRARLEVAVLAPMMMHDQASSIADNNNKQGREHDHPVARTAGAVDRKATLWCDESCRIRII